MRRKALEDVIERATNMQIRYLGSSSAGWRCELHDGDYVWIFDHAPYYDTKKESLLGLKGELAEHVADMIQELIL